MAPAGAWCGGKLFTRSHRKGLRQRRYVCGESQDVQRALCRQKEPVDGLNRISRLTSSRKFHLPLCHSDKGGRKIARLVEAAREIGTPGGTRTPDARLRTPPLYPLSYRGITLFRGTKRWRQGGSNPQPRHCERRALPIELCPHGAQPHP